MDLVIKNGLLVSSSEIFKADIAINNGKIAHISEEINDTAVKEINAEGKYVFPGFIDAHTHMELPIKDDIYSVDDFYTGTLAAAFGGTTSIIDYIVPYQNQSLLSAYKLWRNKAEEKAVIDYGFHITISNPSDVILNEVKELFDYGVTSVKSFTTYLGKYMMTDDQIYGLLKESNKTKMLVCMHCENGYLLDYFIKQFIVEGKTEPIYHELSRPPFLEEEAVGRVIELARFAQSPIFIAHLSTAGGLEKIQKARDSGFRVATETCPGYLLLDKSVYELRGFESAKYICSPPLRPKWHQQKLWEGLMNGVIELVATDHCPFNFHKEKQAGKNDFTKIPNGIPSVEDRVPLIFSEGVIKRKIDLKQFVSIMSTAPAKVFGIYPEKGNLSVGADADIVIYDPDYEWTISAKTHHQNVDYSVFEGKKVVGKPYIIISNGEVIIKNDRFAGKKGRGKYIHRKASSLFD
ncbi:MAG: dihydropyrimidinase [Cyanobacteriota bacterium]